VVKSYDGAWVEDKIFSLTFHYRQVSENLQESARSEAHKLIKKYGFKVSPAHFAVEGKPPVNWHKGSAATFILQDTFGDAWKNQKIIFAGDDTTDEDIMRVLKGIGVSFRVTDDPNLKTYGDFKVPAVSSITTLLKWIDNRFRN
jgi:trehalose 6-phosphate phosphatase